MVSVVCFLGNPGHARYAWHFYIVMQMTNDFHLGGMKSEHSKQYQIGSHENHHNGNQ